MEIPLPTHDVNTYCKFTEGSTDPKTNSELAKAVAAAQKSNMPAATIKKALERIKVYLHYKMRNTYIFKAI